MSDDHQPAVVLPEQLRILILEDNEDDAALIVRQLHKAGITFQSHQVDNRDEFLDQLRNSPPDIILSDYNLPSFRGTSALALASQIQPDTPFIFVSGAIGEDHAIEMLKAGATDYVLKNRLTRLKPAVERALREVEQRRERGQYQEELQESHKQFRALTAHLQSIREEERTRIARELHDELGQALTVLKMDLSWLLKKLSDIQPPLLEKIQSMSSVIDNTILSMKKIATELRPGVLDDLGLVAAIEWQASEFAHRTGIHCAVQSTEEIEIGKEQSTAVFRIFQETLTNVIRHAAASHVDVVLSNLEKEMVLQVSDDGKGIAKEKVVDSSSLGLLGMRERAFMVGGVVEIDGKPGTGTTVTVRVPVIISSGGK